MLVCQRVTGEYALVITLVPPWVVGDSSHIGWTRWPPTDEEAAVYSPGWFSIWRHGGFLSHRATPKLSMFREGFSPTKTIQLLGYPHGNPHICNDKWQATSKMSCWNSKVSGPPQVVGKSRHARHSESHGGILPGCILGSTQRCRPASARCAAVQSVAKLFHGIQPFLSRHHLRVV